MAWITPPVFVALQTLTDSVMNELSSRLSDLWTATTIGDMQYASATDALSRLAIGSTGQYYGVAGGIPAWKDDGVPGLFTAAGDLPYGTGANASARLGIGSARQILKTNSGATAPEWGDDDFSGVSVKRDSSDQTISDITYTSISFDAEDYDTDNFWVIGTPTRLTIPKTGYYLLHALVGWAVNATNVRELKIRKNGSSIATDTRNGLSGIVTRSNISIVDHATATDYYEMSLWQNTGGNLNISQLTVLFEASFLGV